MIELEGFIVQEGLMIILGDVKLLSVHTSIFYCNSKLNTQEQMSFYVTVYLRNKIKNGSRR